VSSGHVVLVLVVEEPSRPDTPRPQTGAKAHVAGRVGLRPGYARPPACPASRWMGVFARSAWFQRGLPRL